MGLITDTNSDLDDLTGLGGGELGEETFDMPADDNEAELNLKPGEAVPADMPKGIPVSVTAGLTSKASRAALRAKLAADALGKEETGEIQDASKLQFSDMLDQADQTC